MIDEIRKSFSTRDQSKPWADAIAVGIVFVIVFLGLSVISTLL